VPGATQSSTMRRNMTDVDLMLREMDERGVDMYALSMTNPMVYWATPAFGLKLSQAINDAGSALHQKHPQRFADIGVVLDHHDAAAARLDQRPLRLRTSFDCAGSERDPHHEPRALSRAWARGQDRASL